MKYLAYEVRTLFKKLIKKVKTIIIKYPVTVLDLTGIIAGIVLIAIGIYKIYPPAMFIIVGGILAFPGIKSKAVK